MESQNRNIPLLLLRAREAMMVHFRPVLTKHQLTEQQWRILRALQDKKQLEPHELCKECCILSPSMAGILKRMKELDLIIRVPSTADRRRVMISLAPGVRERVELIMSENKVAYAKFSKKVGESELESLVYQLENILECLEK